MLARRLFPRSLLALCWMIPALCASMSAATREADPSGTYQGHAPATDAAKRVFTLNLAADGSALLTTLFIGKDDAIQHGHWTQSDTQIVLTFDAIGANRPPHPITFRYRGHQLSPLHWDPSEWGKTGPPVLHRSHTVQGGL